MIVEAALVLPVMVLLVLGIFEFGLVFTSYSTTTASSRSGARLAATNYAPAKTNATTRRTAANQIAASVSADLVVLNNADPIGMVVYKVPAGSTTGAPSGGFPGPGMAGGCTSSCFRYTWNPATNQMVYSSGDWTNPDACGADVDSIGVFVETEHRHITNFFGATRRVIAHTVMRLEPLPTDGCA